MIFLLIWLFFGLIGAALGQRKQLGCAGLLLGVLFGPIGCLLLLFMHGKSKKCPQCGESVRPEAMKCRYCQADLSRVSNAQTDFSLGRVGLAVLFFGVVPVVAFNLWYYLASQKPKAATVATPTATPTAAPIIAPVRLADAGPSQRAALAKYPQLGQKGSPFNSKFLGRLDEWKARGDQRLSRSDWPEKLAADCAEHP